MPITPIDIKSTIMVTDDASRLRETQKTQEIGNAQLVSQNQAKDQEKVETIQDPNPAENKVIRKEDEDSEKEKSQPDFPPREKKQGEDNPSDQKGIPAKDLLRGQKIDIVA